MATGAFGRHGAFASHSTVSVESGTGIVRGHATIHWLNLVDWTAARLPMNSITVLLRSLAVCRGF